MSHETANEAAQHDTPDDKHHVVNVVNEDDGHTFNDHVRNNTLLSEVIAAMYTDFNLTRRPGDRLHCREGGEDVFQFENLTIEKYLEDGHCPHLKWAFAAESGGA